MSVEDFGINPDGLFTKPEARDRMRTALKVSSCNLQVGDALYLATDALAAWLTERSAIDGGQCWQDLAALEHPAEFQRFVAVERNSRRMKNDDITLLRVQVARGVAGVLVVCR